MTVIWIIFIASAVLLPATALLAFWWALRNGEFDHLQKAALSIFNEEEPVGELSDHFPKPSTRANPSKPKPSS